MTNELTQYQEQLPTTGGTLFFDIQRFEHAQRIAKLLSSSTMVPAHFRDNIGNCLIALNYAERLGADPFMVMQRMYVIQGKPGIEGQLVIALVNQSGRFEPLQFEEQGNIKTPEKDTDGVYAYATEKRSGKVLEGPIVDWGTVKNEGWYTKSGSKWKTIAPLMFRYRSATFFARTYCPEVLLGMHTVEELRDVYDLQRSENGAWAKGEAGNEESLTKRLLEAVPDQEEERRASVNHSSTIGHSHQEPEQTPDADPGENMNPVPPSEEQEAAPEEPTKDTLKKIAKSFNCKSDELAELMAWYRQGERATAEEIRAVTNDFKNILERFRAEKVQEPTVYQIFDELQQNDPSGVDEALFECGLDNEPGNETDLQKVIDKYHEMKAA